MTSEHKLDDIALDDLNKSEQKEEQINTANTESVVRTGWERFKTKCKRHTLSLVIIILILIGAIVTTLMLFSIKTRYDKSYNIEQCVSSPENCERQQEKWQFIHELKLKDKVKYVLGVEKMYDANGDLDDSYLFYFIVFGIAVVCKIIHPYITCLLEICIY